MENAEQREIIGDHNIVKGTDYHFVYTLWRLLYQPACISFYAGNDILDRPLKLASPPTPKAKEVNVITSLHAEDTGVDVWIQLKSTSSRWKLSGLLAEEKLLYNFIFNELRSRREGRIPHFELVTQGELDNSEIISFVSSPIQAKFQNQSRKLDSIINAVARQLQTVQNGANIPSTSELRDIAVYVLQELCNSIPRRVDTLVAEIIGALREQTGNLETSRRLANMLLGALLRDASTAPERAHPYDLSWLDRVSGLEIGVQGLFDRNPLAACAEVTKQSLPGNWNEGKFSVPRPGLDRQLERFLQAPETVFILVGASNIGKTWAVARWCLETPTGHARLLIPGRDLDRIEHTRPLLALMDARLRPFVYSQCSPDQLLARLKSATTSGNRGSIVVTVDAIDPTNTDLPKYKNDLARLVEQCKQHRVKLILTCAKSIWQLKNLGSELPPGDIFRAEDENRRVSGLKEELRKSRKDRADQNSQEPVANIKHAELEQIPESAGHLYHTYSFEQGNLTASEMREIISRRLSPASTSIIASHVTEPAFAPLRNPYLLTRYLAQYQKALSNDPLALPVPVEVDALLDSRVEDVLASVASETALSHQDVITSFDALLGQLWAARTRSARGLAYVEAELCFQRFMGSKGQVALSLLQSKGLLTAKGAVDISEPLIAARLFALRMLRRARAGEVWASILQDLTPAVDSDVTVAVLRSVTGDSSAGLDPVSVAQMLLARDWTWLTAVCNGLAQGSASDYRSLAYLTALSRSKPGSLLVPEACDALGELAARSRRAWKWVASMYVTRRSKERLCGARVLGTAIEYDPKRVEGAIRLRMMKAARIADRERQRKYLHGALDPLLGIASLEAASSAERIIELYSVRFLRVDECTRLERANEEELGLIRDVDEARGRIALVFGDDHIDKLLSELRSADPLTRYRGACALRLVAFYFPFIVSAAILSALRYEDNNIVLLRILWDSFPLGDSDPNALLAAIEASRVINWQVPSGAAGQVLGLLGDFCEVLPPDERRRVVSLLPRRLAEYAAWARAFHSEMLAYAWWRVAEEAPEAGAYLIRLTIPDVLGVPKQFRLFAMRGATVAQLGLICAGTIRATELRGHQFSYSHSWLQILTMDLSDFVRRHAKHIVAHPQYPRLERLLMMCLREEQRVISDPRDQLLYQGRYLCAHLCLDMLLALVPFLEEPSHVLAAIPKGEQDLHTTYQLFVEEGNTDPVIVSRVRDLCNASYEGGAVDMIMERELCRYRLAQLEEGSDKALEEHARVHRFLCDADEGATYLAHLAATRPDRILELLDLNFQNSENFALLYYTEENARTWQLVLLARVYARMFSRRNIQPSEARELCQQMLVAVSGLPTSPLAEEYHLVYSAIDDCLAGRIAPLPALPSREGSAIHDSHEFAIQIMRGASEAKQGIDTTWLTNELYSKRAWLDADQHLTDGTMSFHSMGHYLIYVFPAVRLVAVAIGQIWHLADPVAHFMEDRILVHKLYREHDSAFHYTTKLEGESEEWRLRLLNSTLAAFDAQLLITPNDERLWAWKGLLLLLTGDDAGAECALQHCLSLRWCMGDIRVGATYNLACAYAKLGQEDNCQHALEQLPTENSLYKNQMANDPDYSSVREKEWFRAMLDSAC